MKVFVLKRHSGSEVSVYIVPDGISPSKLVETKLAERGYHLCEFGLLDILSSSELNEKLRRDVWFDLDDERFDTDNPVGKGWPKV